MVSIYAVRRKRDGRVVYCGQTRRTLAERWVQHQTGKGALAAAIRKYGADAFSVEKLARVIPEWADEAERNAIAFYGTFGRGKGYNLTAGGDSGGERAEATKKQNADIARKSWADPEVRARRIAGIRAAHAKPETKAKTAAAGRKATNQAEAKGLRREFTADELRTAMEKTGWKLRKTARMLKCSTDTLSRELRKHNLPVRPRGNPKYGRGLTSGGGK